MVRRDLRSPAPVRLAIWFGKGGVGKSTTTMMLSLFAAGRGQRTLTIDLDPECGTSRDFLGKQLDRKSTRLNSGHVSISYAVFCLKKKTTTPMKYSLS